ncbi:MAG: hypothetical protein GQ581_09540 [Methyloprofundus sp.]|nr:hypothetical protein [Methyloprofundus sp.]
MIISHKHKFIFIKTRKTAGTSIEKALLSICGEDDVITRDHLHQGEEDVFKEDARNYEGQWLPVKELLSSRTLLDAMRVGRDWAQRPKFYNHMTANSVKSRIDKGVWDSYYKFCFERNPWDKCISFYYWQGRGGRDLGEFRDYLLHADKRGTIDQTLPKDWRRYSHNNQIIVDDVYDFNDLQGGLLSALGKTNYNGDGNSIQLPSLKSGLRKNNFKYDEDMNEFICKQFAEEIKQFSYKCPQSLQHKVGQ